MAGARTCQMEGCFALDSRKRAVQTSVWPVAGHPTFSLVTVLFEPAQFELEPLSRPTVPRRGTSGNRQYKP